MQLLAKARHIQGVTLGGSKMKFRSTLVYVNLALGALAPNLVTSQTMAAEGTEGADCVLFSENNMSGAAWTAKVGSKDPFVARLTDWWLGQSSSVFVRQGYVLELYSEPYFFGRYVALQSGFSQGIAVSDGISVNLQDIGFLKQVGSYRCRVTTSKVSTPIGEAPWIEGGYYYWYSGGNHYDEKWLKMETVNGHAVITAHSHDTYSINVQDYVIDLTDGLVKINFKAYGGVTGTTEFAFRMAAARTDFHGMLDELVATLKVIAQGYYRPHADKLAPPSPELVELASFFATL
jgi:hypothetical protein